MTILGENPWGIRGSCYKQGTMILLRRFIESYQSCWKTANENLQTLTLKPLISFPNNGFPSRLKESNSSNYYRLKSFERAPYEKHSRSWTSLPTKLAMMFFAIWSLSSFFTWVILKRKPKVPSSASILPLVEELPSRRWRPSWIITSELLVRIMYELISTLNGIH